MSARGGAMGGIDHQLVDRIATARQEPAWMREFRHRSLDIFLAKPVPRWGADLRGLDLTTLHFETETRPSQRVLREEWASRGVLFLDTAAALAAHPELVRQYWATVTPPEDNTYCALNSALWGSGTFIYVPPGVAVTGPLHWIMRMEAHRTAHLERTLIIVDEGASVEYVEGCTAEESGTNALHAAVVEIVVRDRGSCRYSTVQRWSGNVYNLVTKRAHVGAAATMEWIDANLGSRITMTYPAVFLRGAGASGRIHALLQAGDGQHLDAGGKLVFEAPDCSGSIRARSISVGTGRTSYRGLLKVSAGATDVTCDVECNALLVDPDSHTDVYPYIEIDEPASSIAHRTDVRRIDAAALAPLLERGLSADQAVSQLVQEFIEPVARQLPLEYALELRQALEAAVSHAAPGLD